MLSDGIAGRVGVGVNTPVLLDKRKVVSQTFVFELEDF
jgi:hypothetical protein